MMELPNTWLEGVMSRQRLLMNIIEFVVLLAVLFFGDPSPESLQLSLSVVVAGWLLRIWAHGVNPEFAGCLLKGPYLFVKHPYLLGSVLVVLGFAFLGRSIVILVTAILLVTVLCSLVIVYSSRKREVTSDLIVDYERAVPAFMPRIFPFSASQTQRTGGRTVVSRFLQSPVEWMGALWAVFFFANVYGSHFKGFPEWCFWLFFSVICLLFAKNVSIHAKR